MKVKYISSHIREISSTKIPINHSSSTINKLEDKNEKIDHLLTSSGNGSVYCQVLENYKMTKIIKNAQIYNTHICDEYDRIIQDSIRIDWLYHTRDYHIVTDCNITPDCKIKKIHDFCEYLKNNKYYSTEIYPFRAKLSKNYNSVNVIDIPVYVCNIWKEDLWAHTIAYVFTQIYWYLVLREKIPNLYLIISKVLRPEVYELLNILNLSNSKNVIYSDTDTKYINKNVTLCASPWNNNISEVVMVDFYYNIISKQVLNNYNLDKTMYNFPKKLLFLRNSTNALGSTMRILKNRDEIVTIANKYGYTDVDQTKYSLREIICIINNATHIILESGSSLLHLYWTNNIKSLVISYDNTFFHTLANCYEKSNEYLSLISNNRFTDIVKLRKSLIVYNDINYIRDGELSSDTDAVRSSTHLGYTFKDINRIEDAILINE